MQGSWMPPNTWIIGPTWTARIDLLRRSPGETRRGKQHVRNDGVQRNYRSVRPARSGWHGEGWIASTPLSKLESDRPGKVDEPRCDPRTHLFGHVMSQVIAGGPGDQTLSKHSWVNGSSITISRARKGHLNHPIVNHARKTRLPTGREPYGNGVPVVVSGRESRLHGEGGQASQGNGRTWGNVRCG